jgi:glycosyltransferase involved in cell wall biosynthesis
MLTHDNLLNPPVTRTAKMKPLKVAFVNQPIDTIVPPFQNSVGACTWGVLPYLADACDLVVYGLQDANENRKADTFGPNLSFRFFPSTWADRLFHKLRSKAAKLVDISSPMSTSSQLYPAYGRQVAMDVQKQQCDIVHVQHSSQYVSIIREFNPKAKIVLHLHAEWFSQSRFEVLERRLRHIDLLTCVSNHVADKTKQNIPSIADRCGVTYNGVEASEFSREKDYKAARRKEKRILFVGAVSPHKGPHIIVDAFNIVARSYPDVRLDLVGCLSSYPIEESFDLADRELIERVAPFYTKNRLQRSRAKLSLSSPDAGMYHSYLKASLPADIAAKVSFHGHADRSPLIDHYYNADVFVFTPIWEEGFGIPVIEAMAAGAPVVGSRSGGLIETIRHGETGFLVEKNDVRGVAEALLRVLRDDALSEEMGRAARRRVLQYFTWEKVADSMLSRYAGLCEVSIYGSRGSISRHRELLAE